MARIPRKYVVDEDEVGVYHCINRCVRRAFLCGTDSVTGQCFDHRKQWIQDRLEFLAGQFGIDVLAFAVMSNHLHVVVRNRPDVVQSWSDEAAGPHCSSYRSVGIRQCWQTISSETVV